MEVEGQLSDPFFWSKARPLPFVNKPQRTALASSIMGNPTAQRTSEQLVQLIADQVEMREVKETFNRFDENRNGRLDVQELCSALRSLQVDVTEAQATDLICVINKKAASSMEKYVSFDAFVAAFKGGEDLANTTNTVRYIPARIRGLESDTIVHPAHMLLNGLPAPVPGTPTFATQAAAERTARDLILRKNEDAVPPEATAGSARGGANDLVAAANLAAEARMASEGGGSNATTPRELTPRGRRRGQPRSVVMSSQRAARASEESMSGQRAAREREENMNDFAYMMGENVTRSSVVAKATPLMQFPTDATKPRVTRPPGEPIPRPPDGDYATFATLTLKATEEAKSNALAAAANKNRMVAMGSAKEADARSRIDQLSGWRGVDGKMGDSGPLVSATWQQMGRVRALRHGLEGCTHRRYTCVTLRVAVAGFLAICSRLSPLSHRVPLLLACMHARPMPGPSSAGL